MIEVINMTIDECRLDILSHIEKVRKYIRFFTDKLTTRGEKHDASKLEEPEISGFAEHTECLSNTIYGSPEYYQHLEALHPILEHHYALNRHHPEYYKNGISEMNLLDVIQMLCDWKASSERTRNGNLLKSIEVNIERFNIDEQLGQILINTAKLLEQE